MCIRDSLYVSRVSLILSLEAPRYVPMRIWHMKRADMRKETCKKKDASVQAWAVQWESIAEKMCIRDSSCIEPYSQVMFHLGYEFDENDAHDVKLLCETLHIEIPNEYR